MDHRYVSYVLRVYVPGTWCLPWCIVFFVFWFVCFGCMLLFYCLNLPVPGIYRLCFFLSQFTSGVEAGRVVQVITRLGEAVGEIGLAGGQVREGERVRGRAEMPPLYMGDPPFWGASMFSWAWSSARFWHCRYTWQHKLCTAVSTKKKKRAWHERGEKSLFLYIFIFALFTARNIFLSVNNVKKITPRTDDLYDLFPLQFMI